MANGDRYYGTWVKGKLQGYGEHHTQDESYSGTYFNNRESGRGKKTMQKLGFTNEGQFLNGLFEGPTGKQYYTNGDYYRGAFSKGVREG
jgi:hypothetical protein